MIKVKFGAGQWALGIGHWALLWGAEKPGCLPSSFAPM